MLANRESSSKTKEGTPHDAYAENRILRDCSRDCWFSSLTSVAEARQSHSDIAIIITRGILITMPTTLTGGTIDTLRVAAHSASGGTRARASHRFMRQGATDTLAGAARAANGSVRALTAAHRTLPFGTMVRVTNAAAAGPSWCASTIVVRSYAAG